MFLSPKEIVEQYVDVSISKSKLPLGRLLGKSFFAGLMIAMGAACSNVAVHGIDNVGIARLVAGCVFPVGLMMVIVLGAELFTGDCLMIMGVLSRKINILCLMKTLIYVYVGNFIGSVFLAFMIKLCGQLDYSNGKLGAYTIKLALGKVMLTPVQAISSGILCNILVCIAVLMALAANHITGKLFSSFFVIMVFVIGGFEHCVANMYYIIAGILAKMNESYVQLAAEIYGIQDVSALNVKNMLCKNLLPVTIGNIVGGILCIGVFLYYLNLNAKER